jgi:hypothetical protein
MIELNQGIVFSSENRPDKNSEHRQPPPQPPPTVLCSQEPASQNPFLPPKKGVKIMKYYLSGDKTEMSPRSMCLEETARNRLKGYCKQFFVLFKGTDSRFHSSMRKVLFFLFDPLARYSQPKASLVSAHGKFKRWSYAL